MKRPTVLPVVTMREKQWIVDVRLGEFRDKETAEQLTFNDFERTATPLEMLIVAAAISDYLSSQLESR